MRKCIFEKNFDNGGKNTEISPKKIQQSIETKNKMKHLVKSKSSLRVALLLLAISATSGPAAILTFSGTFTTSTFINGPNITPGPSTPLSGSWSFSFDDSAVMGSGLEAFSPALTTFTISGPIGSTTFDTSNTGAEIAYFNGALSSSVIIAGSINGFTEPVASSADDFNLIYANTSSTSSMRVTNLGVNEQASANTLSGSYTVVPEPSSLALFAAGLAAISLRRKRCA